METITLRKGNDYAEVSARLAYIHANRQDRIIPLDNFGMAPNGALAYREDNNSSQFALNSWSAGQVASYANVPKQYFDRISAQNPELLSLMVNHSLLERRKEVISGKREARMFRTLDGTLQALVSPSFLTVDGFQIMQMLQPVLDSYGFKVIQADITDKRLYVNAVTEALTGEVKEGDVINYGVTISTSDVGAGSISISPYLFRLVCKNGLKTESHFRRRHVGKNKGDDDFRDLLSSDTVYHENKALLGTARDMLLGSMRPEVFSAEIAKLKETTTKVITNYNLQDVVDRASKFYAVTDQRVREAVTQELGGGNQGAGLTMWGLMNSFTSVAKTTLVDIDEADRLERIAGDMPSMSASQWHNIAQVKH